MNPLPSSQNARQLAWYILRRWTPEGVYAEDMVDHEAVRAKLSRPDRALLNAIVMATLRHGDLLDHYIHYLRDGGKLEDEAREWLRIGLAQIMIMGLPEHAAVNETVNLAGRARGLVNAVLRRALRERDALEKIRLTTTPDVRHSLPEFLVAAWMKRYGAAEVETLGTWCNTPAPVFVRANPLRADSAAICAALPSVEQVTGPDNGTWFRVSETPRAELAAGLCYAQDPSTGMAPAMLAPKARMIVLDACAAPGGKAGVLAGIMGNSGTLVATDSSAHRLERMRGNLERLGVTCVESLQHDWETTPATADFKSRFADGFDRILLDVPCSNTGVLRRRVDLRWRLTADFFDKINGTQHALLSRLLPWLKVGGRLVYSTCSIEPVENELLVADVLSDLLGFRLLEERTLLPQRDQIDGAYAALIERLT